MFTELLASGSGSGGGNVFTKKVQKKYSQGTNTLTFPDFTEIYAIRLGDGNYITAYIDENGNLQNAGGFAPAMTATNISGNVVTITVAAGYAGNYNCYVTGK